MCYKVSSSASCDLSSEFSLPPLLHDLKHRFTSKTDSTTTHFGYTNVGLYNLHSPQPPHICMTILSLYGTSQSHIIFIHNPAPHITTNKLTHQTETFQRNQKLPTDSHVFPPEFCVSATNSQTNFSLHNFSTSPICEGAHQELSQNSPLILMFPQLDRSWVLYFINKLSD